MTDTTSRSWFQRRFLAAQIILLILVCSSGLHPAPTLSTAQSERLSLRVDVELVTVEVIVLDKKGFPIRNLKREDFELYEDGKRQDIVTFAEVSDEQNNREVPTSLADLDDSGLNRGKVVLILFDDSHISGGQLSISRQSAEQYVKEQMRPQDLFAVATYGLSLKLLQNFTHDAAKVVEAIRQPALSFAMAGSRQGAIVPGPGAQGRQPGGTPALDARAMRNPELRMRVVSMFRALNSISASVAAVRGRKAVLIFSEDFSGTSDVESELSTTVDRARRANVSFYTVDVMGLLGGPLVEMSPERRANPPSGTTLRSAFSPVASLFNRLAPANLGASFSMLQQSGGGQSGGGQTGGGGSGRPGGGAPPSSGGSTGGRPAPGGNTPGNTPGTSTNPNTSRDNSATMGRDNTGRQEQPDFGRFAQPMMNNLLRSLATETGGVAIYNTSDFNRRLNEVTRELNNYYVLGFQSNNPKRDGKFRRLKVKTDVKRGDLRYRDGYVDPRPLDSLAGSKGEKSMLRAIASPTPAAQLLLAFNAVYFYDSPGLARIPITAKIRTGSVELKNKGGQLTGDLDVMGVAYGADGGVSARFSETLHLAVPKENEPAFRQEGINYRNHFKLRPGKYQLKIAVADEKGKVGSAEQPLVVPPQNSGELAASSLVLIDQASRLPALIQDLQTRLLEDGDPLIYRGLQIVPAVENQLTAGKPVNVAFRIYNLSGSAEQPEQLKLVAEPKLIGENGATIALRAVALDPKHLYPAGSSEAMVALSLPFADVTPGRYKLVLATSEGATNRSVILETELQIR